ncbi:PREDICTED: protein hunchback-like, partial [Dinoponera quadriceps]|uniref:Protein hunchback-like n=1 Tax=Dinoponera quadriceps TaxID=609295 RepID=A0A6P3Y142_DINQU
HEEEALGSREVARGHPQQFQTRPQRSRPRRQYHRHPQNHNHHHHHHHHHYHHHQLSPPQRHRNQLPHIYQQDHQQRHQRFHPDRSPSPSFSPLNDDDCVAGRCSPRAPRHSRRSSARSSPSRWPSPASSTSPLGTPSRTMSRGATPSPPNAASVPSTAAPASSCWNLPRKLFTCRVQGSARIDFISRIAFPLMFILFNFAYWCIYLFQGEDGAVTNK